MIIEKIIIPGVDTYIFTDTGYPKAVFYHRTKAVHSQEIITIIFDHNPTAKPSTFIFKPYRTGEETQGIYLGSIKRTNEEWIHYYYERREPFQKD